jgi:hypothetical protein
MEFEPIWLPIVPTKVVGPVGFEPTIRGTNDFAAFWISKYFGERLDPNPVLIVFGALSSA